MKRTKTLEELAIDLEKHVKAREKLKRELLKAIVQRRNMDMFSVFYNKFDDGLPKKIIEDEEWN